MRDELFQRPGYDEKGSLGRWLLGPAGRLIVCCLLLVGASGCITASLAVIGSVLGFAGTAASTGAEAYQLGKLDTSFMASYDQSRLAVYSSAAELGLHICRLRDLNKTHDWCEFEIKDDRKAIIHVRIERRAAMLCQCRVDVGWFGSEPTARLFTDTIRHQLPIANEPPASQPTTQMAVTVGK